MLTLNTISIYNKVHVSGPPADPPFVLIHQLFLGQMRVIPQTCCCSGSRKAQPTASGSHVPELKPILMQTSKGEFIVAI